MCIYEGATARTDTSYAGLLVHAEIGRELYSRNQSIEGRKFIYSPELIRESRRVRLRDEALWIDHNCSHMVELRTSFATASNVVWLLLDDLHHIKKCQQYM